MVKKTNNYFTCFIFLFQFTSLQGKEYFAKLNQLSGAGAGFLKKKSGAGAA